MRSHFAIRRIISILLTVSLLFSLTACASDAPTNTGLSDPNPQIISENIEEETILTENTLTEFITSEIYLEEMVIAEDKISELLLVPCLSWKRKKQHRD